MIHLKHLLRYSLFQIPGIALAAYLGWLLERGGLISETLAWCLPLAWAIKDAILYPFVRRAYFANLESPAEPFVGRIAVVEAPSHLGRDRVLFNGELWPAESSDDTRLQPGMKVRVKERRGLVLVVEVPDPKEA